MKFALSSLIVLASLLVCAQPSRKTVDLHQLATSVDKHYNGLNSLETQFSENYRGGGLSRMESGTMWIKKPGKMLWQYTAPRQKLFVTDGRTAWFYVPGEKQARRASVKKLDDLRSPLRYLLGRSKLEKEFAALSLAPDLQPTNAGDIVLRGVPKGMEDRVSMVLLEVTPDYRLARIYIEELDGSQTDFRFSNQRDNVPVADSKFSFRPPAGVEVMEGTELQP
jgi:outer membrane lipoprotein carrier protein